MIETKIPVPPKLYKHALLSASSCCQILTPAVIFFLKL